jgi:hypothetical protein
MRGFQVLRHFEWDSTRRSSSAVCHGVVIEDCPVYTIEFLIVLQPDERAAGGSADASGASLLRSSLRPELLGPELGSKLELHHDRHSEAAFILAEVGRPQTTV